MLINQSNIKWNGSLKYNNNPQKIIIHNADHPNCSVYDVDRWHKNNGWSGIGYQYFIRKDGTIWTGRPETAVGAHTIDNNSTSIGICLEGAFMKEKPTRLQLNSLSELIADIRNRRGKLPIYGHKDLNNTNCPGANFPLNDFKNNAYKPAGGVDTGNNNSEYGFYESNEKRTNATIVGSGNIEVLNNKGEKVNNRYISSLDRIFVLGVYPSSKIIEVVYPGKDTQYHAYIDIKYYNRISFDYHMGYKNDGGITYVWWDSDDVNVKNHNEELKAYQKASPMYRVNGWLRITFYRADGVASDGYVRYEGEQEERFYTEVKKKQYGEVIGVNSYLNVRSTPGGDIIGKVFPNEEVEILDNKTGWYYIEYDTIKGKKKGYISAKYLKVI